MLEDIRLGTTLFGMTQRKSMKQAVTTTGTSLTTFINIKFKKGHIKSTIIKNDSDRSYDHLNIEKVNFTKCLNSSNRTSTMEPSSCHNILQKTIH